MSELNLDDLERSLQRSVLVRLRFYSGVSAVWGAAQFGLFRLLHPGLGPLLYALTAGFVVCAALVFLRMRSLPWSSARITAVGVGLGLYEMVVHAVSAQQTGAAMYLYIAALVLVSAGAMLLHHVWSAIYAVGGALIMVTIGRPPSHEFVTDVMLFGAATVASVLIHAVGRHYFVDIETLRQRDREQTVALEAALAETRRQLAEREHAEGQRAAMETERRQLEEQLVQAQKMEALGTLAGGFAHDMNNVLGGILAGAELLREDVQPALRQDLDDLITATQRGAELTRNLLGFARRGQYRKEVVDVRAVVTSMIRLLQRTVPKGVVFESRFEEPGPTIEGDPSMLTQALVNLCLNSVDAMRGVGQLTIAVRTVELEGASYASIAVTDTGCGMDAETRRRMFEPFFTTKKLGHGTGLGLAMVYGTVKAWNGMIEVESEVGTGTTMIVRLPTVAARDAVKPKRNSAAMRVGVGTILIVDDDARIRKVARRVLEARGYTIFEACDGADGVAMFDAHRPEIQLVILDMAMPVMAGAECFRVLRERDPEVRVLLASGYALEDDARRCLSEGALGFIDKPYTVEIFTSAVSRALRGELVSAPLE